MNIIKVLEDVKNLREFFGDKENLVSLDRLFGELANFTKKNETVLAPHKNKSYFEVFKKLANQISYWAVLRKQAKDLWQEEYDPLVPLHVIINQSMIIKKDSSVESKYHTEKIPPLVICPECKSVTLKAEFEHVHCGVKMELL
jgi:hypothetical protein